MTPWSSGTNNDLSEPTGCSHKQRVLHCSIDYHVCHGGIKNCTVLVQIIDAIWCWKIWYKQNNELALDGLRFGSTERGREKAWFRLHMDILSAASRKTWSDGKDLTGKRQGIWTLIPLLGLSSPYHLVQCLNDLLKRDFKNMALSPKQFYQLESWAH